MLLDISGDSVSDAVEAVLSLALQDPDRDWLEELLISTIETSRDAQVRAIAVVSLGHVARIHRSVTRDRVVPVLNRLLDDPELGSRAANALEDIDIFASARTDNSDGNL